MKRRLTAILALILTMVLLITGCSAPSTTEGSTQASQVGKLAPDFQLQDLDGQSISLSGFRGKPVLLNFWATWCLSCREEMPIIQEAFEEWSNRGLVILAIDIGESRSTVKDFMQSYNLSFPALLDTSQDVALEYNIRYIPTTFLIDKNGIIQVVKIGPFQNKEEIEAGIRKVIP